MLIVWSLFRENFQEKPNSETIEEHQKNQPINFSEIFMKKAASVKQEASSEMYLYMCDEMMAWWWWFDDDGLMMMATLLTN